MKIIIYGSQYGTAKQYAEELARKTSIDLKSYEDVTDINRYDTVIYVLRFCRGSKKELISISTAGETDTVYELKYASKMQGVRIADCD